MFSRIRVGQTCSRPELASMWGYAGYQALARGVVTPRDTNKIILFITLEKQADLEQYDDDLVADTLYWEGPNDHFAEERMIAAAQCGEEIHVFCRRRHHTDFTYCGQAKIVDVKRLRSNPSRFVLRLIEGVVDVE